MHNFLSTKKTIFLLPAVLLFGVLFSQAQTKPRESLHGLHGVFLYIHPVGHDVEAGGLTTEQVKIVVEKSLKQAGLTVYNEPQPAEGSANLVVIIDIVKHPQGAFLYSVEVSLLQEVHLARTKEADPFPAQTWGSRALGLTSPNRTDLILEPLKAKVEDFIADYKAANKGAN
jgi:hypothetical protein